MFKIIGTDGKTYGPVSEQQLRQWIGEGRVNASTLIQPEGSADWKPLSEFPQFAQAAPPPLGQYSAPPVLSPYDDRKSKLAAGLMGIFLGGIGVHRFYLGYTTIGVVQIIVTCATCGVGHFWGLIEGILIIAGTTITTDAQGRPLKD
jgi:TM2 domain-containing membrane protein YozV